MPLQILDWGDVPGTKIASGLGAGLSEGMKALADMKMKEYAQRQQAAKNEAFFKTLPGMTPENAQALSNASPELQQLFYKNMANAPLREVFAQALGKAQQGGQPGQEQGNAEELTNLLAQLPPEKALPIIQLQETIKSRQAQQDLARQKQELTQQKQEFVQQKEAHKQAREKEQLSEERRKEVAPYIRQTNQAYQDAKEMSSLAEQIQKLLPYAKNKWPSGAIALFDPNYQEAAVRDPVIRKIGQLSQKIALTAAKSGKGLPSVYRIKAEEGAKLKQTMPFWTVESIVKDIIGNEKKEARRIMHRDYQRNKKTGQYPIDIETRMVHYDLAHRDPLSYPDVFKKGYVLTLPEGKFKVVEENGIKRWEKLK
jgi:hypothetical protein